MKKVYDVIIIGAGPAGMTAAMYAARAKMSVLLMDRGMIGGQMTQTLEIENFPSYPKITGRELSQKMFEHAIGFGAEYTADHVRSMTQEGMLHVVETDRRRYKAKSVIIATGTQHKHLGVPGEKELAGMGVSYCAVCDGAFFNGMEIVVVGGGDSAVEEAIYLTKYASKVTIIHRRDEFRAQKILQERAFQNHKIQVIWNHVVKEIVGKDMVEGVRIENVRTKEESFLPCQGVFIYVGMNPLSQPFKELGILNENGYIPTNERMETKVRGIFAAGDIREKELRQIVTATGDGSIAAQSAHHYVEEWNERWERVIREGKNFEQ